MDMDGEKIITRKESYYSNDYSQKNNSSSSDSSNSSGKLIIDEDATSAYLSNVQEIDSGVQFVQDGRSSYKSDEITNRHELTLAEINSVLSESQDNGYMFGCRKNNSLASNTIATQACDNNIVVSFPDNEIPTLSVDYSSWGSLFSNDEINLNDNHYLFDDEILYPSVQCNEIQDQNKEQNQDQNMEMCYEVNHQCDLNIGQSVTVQEEQRGKTTIQNNNNDRAFLWTSPFHEIVYIRLFVACGCKIIDFSFFPFFSFFFLREHSRIPGYSVVAVIAGGGLVFHFTG